MQRKVFMVAKDIDVDKGGINHVMFSRTHLFNNELYSSAIISLDDKTNYPEIEAQLKEDGRLHSASNIINIYDFYRDKFTEDGGINEEMQAYYKKMSKLEEEGSYFQQEKNIARYFKNGQYDKFKRWDENGQLEVVDYFSEMRVRHTREEYHPEGYLLRKSTFHPANNKLTQIHYFTKEGFCYLTRWFDHKTEKQQRIVLFSPDKQKVKVFNDNTKFLTNFLEEICLVEAQPPIVICDGPGASAAVIDMAEDVAIRLYAIHTNHLQKPYTLGSGMKPGLKKILMNPDVEAPIVVLTNRQKIDIETEFSERPWNIHVVSNAVSTEFEKVEKEPNLIVVIGRYEEEKRFNLIVDAFKKTLDEVPDAKLHFYGSGSKKQELKKQIKRLKLNRSLKLYDYTIDGNEKLARALFTLNTSEYEGQGLVILEAMAQRTPTISFKINYIVRELYDQSAGRLVENGQVDALAEAMVDALYNVEDTLALGEKAYEIVQKNYNYKKQYEDWIAVFTKEIAHFETKKQVVQPIEE